MSFDWLRRRLKEQIENGSDTMSDAAPAITPAVNIPAPKTDTTVSVPKIDPKTGVNGAKTFSDISAKKPTLGKNSINDLIDAYNAGYNGTDINEEIKENARAGDYMSEIEAAVNAGLQDAKVTAEAAAKAPSIENSKAAIPSVNIPDNNVPKDLSNTSGNTAGNPGADNNTDDFPYMDNFTPGPNTESFNATEDYSFPFITSQREKDYNYMEDMLFLNGAQSSSDPDIQKAYEYLSNYENRGKQIPDEIMKAFNRFMEDLKNGTNTADSYSGANNSGMDVQMALQYVKDPKNQGKISPETVKAIMGKATAQDLSTQTMRNDQIRRSQQIALDADNIDYYNYDLLKARNILKLGVSHDKREGDLWCWAACMSTINNFYNPGKEINQETLHDLVNPNKLPDTKFGVPDCRSYVNFTLDKKVYEVPSYEIVAANIRAGQPIVLHTRKPGEKTPKHFIVIAGCYVKDGVQYVIINENRNGRQYSIPFNELGKGFTTCDNAQVVDGYYTTSKN